MNRVGIFCFYDPQGIVDDYIVYLLQQVKKSLTHLIIVGNGDIDNQNILKLKELADELVLRDNSGFDFGAYKCGISHLENLDDLEDVDEIVLFNGTFFGPLFPLQEMFESMKSKEIDFWGVTAYPGYNESTDLKPFGEKLSPHIQSYWIVIKKDMINSTFFDFWRRLPIFQSFEEAVTLGEAKFTDFFARKGFRWDSYVKTEKFNSLIDNSNFYLSYELISEQRMPFVKRKVFIDDYEIVRVFSVGNNASKTLDFIKKSTNFDIDMIWKNILRTGHLVDIKENLHLNYIISSDLNELNAEKMKIALAIHLFFEDQIESCMSHIKKMPINTDIWITTDTENKKKKILERASDFPEYQIYVEVVRNKGRDVSALLFLLKNHLMRYDLVCFFHGGKKQLEFHLGL